MVGNNGSDLFFLAADEIKALILLAKRLLSRILGKYGAKKR